MNKIYPQHNNNNNSHRTNVAGTAAAASNAAAGAPSARAGPQNSAVVPPTASQTTTNVPNTNNNHGQQQQHHHHHHHQRQHGHNPHQHHHQHQHQQHHQQHYQQQQHQLQAQQQQSQAQPTNQQHNRHHNPHHHQQQQNPAYVPHPTGHMAHDVLDHQHQHHPQQQQPPLPHQHHHHHPHPHSHPHGQQQAPPQQVQSGAGVQQPAGQQAQPVSINQSNQHNPMVKHHPPTQQTSMPNSQIHQTQPHHHHHHHNHHHNHHMQHQAHISISPSMPPQQQAHPGAQQQWVPGPQPHASQPQSTSQQQHHHQQQAPPSGPQQQQTPHPQTQSQQQQPPQPQPPQQAPPPPHHHIPHPSAPPMMINHQQYAHSPPNLFYPPQLSHGFVPPSGHVPQYDQTSAASHQPDPANLNSQQQQQQQVSINNHHPGSMPLTQLSAPIMSTATTGTTNVHHLNNGTMLDATAAQMPNRLPMNQQAYVLPYMMLYPHHPHLQNMNPYPGAPHMPPPSPATIISPIRVPNDIGIRQQYDPQNQNNPIPTSANLNQQPGSKPPPVSMPSTATMATTPATPILHTKRESRGIPIVNPLTRKPLTKDELLATPTTPSSQQLPKDSSAPPRISSQDASVSSNRESFTDDASTKSSTDFNPSDKQQPVTKENEVSVVEQIATKLMEPSSVEVKKIKVGETLEIANTAIATATTTTTTASSSTTTQAISAATLTTASTTITATTKIIVNERVVENGETESNDENLKDLTDGVAVLSITSDNAKPSEERLKVATESELKENTTTPVKKQNSPDLPYAAGQFSPLNPNGSKRYSIKFLMAVAKELKIDFEQASTPNHRIDQFAPHYVNQVSGGNYRDYPSSQPLMRRSSQQVMAKPKKIIVSHSLQQEVELKTAEKPWKPELESEKSKLPEDNAKMDTNRLLKVFRGHLNKLTPQKYDSLIEKIRALDLDEPERLNSVIDLVFDKAVDEPGFCELYAKMCKVIAAKSQSFCFHLVKKCQDEFETSDLYDGLNVDERNQEIEQELDVAKKKLMSEELYEDMRLRRKKYLGTIKLIGEMYKLSLLAAKIIGFCMKHLIQEPSNENIECLCSLIATVGQNMVQEQDEEIKASLRNTLTILQDLAHSKRGDDFALESRVKFKILDTIDLSRRNWRPRMVENNPKKIEEIREEAKEELMRQQHHNHPNQSKNLLKPDDRDKNRRAGGYISNTFSKGRW